MASKTKRVKRAAPKARARERAESITERIRREVQAAASGSRRVFYAPKAGVHKFIRFLTELKESEGGKRDPVIVEAHDDYDAGVRMQPCRRYWDKECIYCKKHIKLQTYYVFTVYDYRSAKRMVWPLRATDWGPMGTLLDAFDKYGSLLKRDFRVRRDPNSPRRVICEPAKTEKPFEGKERAAFTEDEVYAILLEEGEADEARRQAKAQEEFEETGGPRDDEFEAGGSEKEESDDDEF